MKKVYLAILALAAFTFASCEKNPIGGTATEKMAGQWQVCLQHCNENDSVLYDGEDLFGVSPFLLLTFNAADNSADSLWVSDLGNFWDFQVKTACNQALDTFGIIGGADIANGISVDIFGGKILFGAAKTPSGAKADSIVFDVSFSDDPYVGTYYHHHRITGFRYTGLAADE